jgi:arylsulfatase A-like enzyme
VDKTTPTSNRPLRGGKATVYEGGTRVPCIVAWPGLTQPGSRSDTVIQSADFYPTFVQLLGLKTPSGQIFDGVSIADAFAGKPLNRQAIFTYFPHSPPIVPDVLPPAVTVVAGEWKLIRLFYDGENGAHAYRLYNLKEDLGEQHDLAATQPDRVKQLDALIEKYLSDTKAVTPKPNPAHDPNAKAPPAPRKPATKPKKKPAAETNGRLKLEAQSDAGL